MDTTTLSGISSAAAQAPPASTSKPVTPVKAAERSSGTTEQKSSSGKDARQASNEAKTPELTPGEKGPHKDVEERSDHHAEDSLIEIVSDSFDKGTKLKVDRDEDTGRIIFQTVMKETGEVVRQVPTREMIQLAKSLNMGKGLLVNKEA